MFFGRFETSTIANFLSFLILRILLTFPETPETKNTIYLKFEPPSIS